MLFCDSDNLFFQILPDFAHLTKATGDDDRTCHPLFPAISEDPGNGLGRRGDQDHFNGAFNFGNLFMARKPQDIFFLGIHGINPSLKTLVQQGLNGLISPFGFFFGSPHHRNGRCVQHMFQTHEPTSP